MGIYDEHLDKNAANYVPLSPLSFLRKAASIYPDYTATIYGERRITWRDTYARVRALASALAKHAVTKGTTVAAMLPNIPAMFELHYAPALLGAVLNTLNTRLDAETIAFMLDHGEAKVLFTDREFSSVVEKALTHLLCEGGDRQALCVVLIVLGALFKILVQL